MLIIEEQATPYTLTLEVDTKQLNELFDKHWEVIKDDIELDGFRKGSIPKDVAEKKIGHDKLYSKLIPELYMDELHQSNIDVVYSSEPKIFGSFNREGFIRLITDCYLTPKVEIGSLNDIHVHTAPVYITDDEIELEIKKIRQKYSILTETSDPIQYGNTIILDFIGFVDGVEIQGSKGIKYKLKVGSNNFIEGFEDQLIGLKQHDIKDIQVTFPVGYHKQNLAGKPAIFNVKIREVFKNTDISDDELLQKENCTLDELKNKIKHDLLSEKEDYQNKIASADALKQLVKTSKIGPIPKPCIYQELDQRLEQFVADSGKTLEELKTQFPTFETVFENNNKEIIIEGIKSTLVLQELKKEFDPVVTEDEIKALWAKRYQDEFQKNTPKYIVVESQLKIQKTLELLVAKVTQSD